MTQRIPALDGIRGIAILLVLWLHLAISGFWGLTYPPSLGRLGVSLFFVLSGYLITRILLDRPQTLGRFWGRRALRIFPAFYLYLTVVAVLWAVGLYSLQPSAFGAAASYLMNFYRGPRGWPLEHTWSLAIEEQFYLLWPVALLWLGPRRCSWALGSILLAWPLQRFLRTGQWGHPGAYEALYAATFDAIIWGCLIALWAHQRPTWRPPTAGTVAAIAAVLLTALRPEALPTVLLPMVRNAALAWLVAWAAIAGRGGTRAYPVLGWFGTRSYSLYLWHLLFCDPRWVAYSMGQLAPLGALLAAELSFRCVERPPLRWRDRHFGDQAGGATAKGSDRRDAATGRANSPSSAGGKPSS